MTLALLPNRAVIRVGGPEAQHFLQNLVTSDIDSVSDTSGGYGALLTPQGKIQFDFLIYKSGGTYLIDTPRETASDLLKRLTFYRLRSKVDLELADDTLAVLALWGSDKDVASALVSVADPRLEDLGRRIVGPADAIAEELGTAPEGPEAYHAHRIALGVPEGLEDYAYSEIFPHDAGLDQLNGVSFSKGCYVGQEVVSRVHHRGTARKRFVLVESAENLPAMGTDVTADGKSIGTSGSSTALGDVHKGLALLRLDKAKAALDNGTPLFCGAAPVSVSLPAWAGFGWPQDAAAE
ncbi:YgfZ/GcvT domain-containing protein [Roseibium denhamense]|uniref:Folate-binding protein n=1 Tax=Roseibium denhamense TaxID=76305 RepID=A0ABY1P3V0_9HYPH|nr:folate-binding protein YgfZ [Roseibium denhamense]SMP25721.1 hypothetical protein SAMN06265374_2596 [Roseibium denhamense]